MEHDVPFGNSNRQNGPTFLDFPLFLGIFQLDELTKRVPFTAEPEIPEILTKWKAPSINRVSELSRSCSLSKKIDFQCNVALGTTTCCPLQVFIPSKRKGLLQTQLTVNCPHK